MVSSFVCSYITRQVCSTKTGRLIIILVSIFLLYRWNILALHVFLDVPRSPTSLLFKSHACFEARSNKQEKYTECTYKHKNHLYIFIYILMHRSHSKRMVRQFCTKESPGGERANKPNMDRWQHET